MEASMVQLPFPNLEVNLQREWAIIGTCEPKMQQEDLYGA